METMEQNENQDFETARDQLQYRTSLSEEFFKDNKYYYEIEITSKDFNNSQFICEGEQAVTIFEVLDELILDYQWAVDDVVYNYNDPEQPLPWVGNMSEPLIFENSQKFIEYASKIQQFISGVFLGGSRQIIERIDWKRFGFLDTEGPKTNLGPADIEIRAFDTTYFLIFTTRRDVGDRLCSRFPGIVPTKQSWI